MNINDQQLAEKLEFPKVVHLLQKHCYGSVGRNHFEHLPIETERLLILSKLHQVAECRTAIAEDERPPLGNYEDIRTTANRLSIENFVLTQEMLLDIRVQLTLVRALFEYFTSLRKEKFPHLSRILGDAIYQPDLLNSIHKVLDEDGNVRPDASDELQRLHRQKIVLRRELDQSFTKIISQYRKNGWLTDTEESFRNGRRVLSVPAEHKRKINGIIHDESATGRTVFIEPQSIIEINNGLFNIEAEERRELYRIFKALSAQLRPNAPLLLTYQRILVQMDIVQAKAQLALQLDAQMPKIVDRPNLHILNGRHPLLYLKNAGIQRKTIPFDLHLHPPNRILLLSGPNAGGKTILMKAVGLLQLMTQAGLLVPVSAESEIGIFENIFVEIGDSQSLEDDLSTYSSHLQHMHHFLEAANGKSLMLIDEFGSGTDPKMGGAIAESLLRAFNKQKVFGIITTHFSNLKMFAYKHKGIVNGAMTFDKTTLSPTFRLEIGRPGSSYAFEIAQKSGFGKDLLHYARHKAGESAQQVDQLLIDLQQEKKELEENLEKAIVQKDQLDKLISNYEMLSKDLEFKRKKLKLEQKQQRLQHKAQEEKVLQEVIKELKETESLEKAKRLAKQKREERMSMTEDVQQLDQQIYKVHQQRKDQSISEGSHVKVRNSGTIGQVVSIDKKKAIILVGQLRMTVKLRDLIPANEPIETNRKKRVQLPEAPTASSFESRLDVRGMYPDEASRVLQKFMEQAVMSGVSHLEIIHGKGSGVLRKTVQKKLREYVRASQLSHPSAENGGDGVTVVDMRTSA